MTLYNIMEIFHRRQQDLQQIKNAFLLHPPPFQQRGTIPRPPPNQQQPPQHPNRPPAPPPLPLINQEKPPTSFLINDILSGSVGSKISPSEDTAHGMKRPWDDQGSSRSSSPVQEAEEEIDVGDEKPQKKLVGKNSPLDALFKMTNKTFDETDGSGNLGEGGQSRDQMSGLFSKNQSSKKRRKSRTAFSNQQIYELEKRFLYQKYLTPADRDEIAQLLSLTNAQVITWFQNRRAKLKRDLEELKADVTAAKVLCKEPPTVLTRLEEMQAYTTQQSLIKWEKRALKMPGKYPTGFNPLSLLDDNKDTPPFSPHKDNNSKSSTFSPHSLTDGQSSALSFSPHKIRPPISPGNETVMSDGADGEGDESVISDIMDTSINVNSHLNVLRNETMHANPRTIEELGSTSHKDLVSNAIPPSPSSNAKDIPSDDVTGCHAHHNTHFQRDHVGDSKTPD